MRSRALRYAAKSRVSQHEALLRAQVARCRERIGSRLAGNPVLMQVVSFLACRGAAAVTLFAPYADSVASAQALRPER
jgi:hypothetical protein